MRVSIFYISCTVRSGWLMIGNAEEEEEVRDVIFKVVDIYTCE
jgi:hypothetical protein